ncbi:MAG: galactose mutarotase [Lachnospiraceae bacterium]|nr:galactose mutarotase [Lachnospiraceae bacterium]
MSVSTRNFGKTSDGREVTLYSIENGKGAKADIIDYGAILVNLFIPNDKGEVKDIVLGYDNVADYEVNDCFFGATVGPSANRIGGCRFCIDGVEYKLADNDEGNNLHSDFDTGFHKRMWKAEAGDDSVKFVIEKADMDMGFPGNMTASVTYSLSDDNELKLEYEGISDKATIFNITNHTYFALGGQEDTVNNMYETELMINASKYTYILPGAIPNGETPEVKGTPMDFTKPKKIGLEIDADWEQMNMVGGYDHNYVLDGYDGSLRLAARASRDGRTMEVYTDLPGIQFYSGNSIKPCKGKNGASYVRRSAFCMETQYFPNSVNIASFDSPIKAAGEKYHTVTVYKFC